jgi:N-acyl-D-aspartate/D-glutamate deacylase
MPGCDTLIRNALVVDGSGGEPLPADVALADDRIRAVGSPLDYAAGEVIEGAGYVLAPGFIDVHTHDDTNVIRTPEMLPKLTQGVTTVVVGNCGISAAPVQLKGDPPDPMNLVGDAMAFQYPTFASFVAAIGSAQPAVNVAALVGHTALRNNHMERLDRAATKAEIEAMRRQLIEALDCGALGLSTGLAYLSANAATIDEVLALAEPLAQAGGVYTTHLRSETEAIIDALREAFTVGRECRVPVVISHLKCAGIDNWGRSSEVLQELDGARPSQTVSWDCYPYAAGSSTLDLRQVDERVEIRITWSAPHPEAGGRTLAQIARDWEMGQLEAARRLQPAGAIYHSISEDDMRSILRHPATMIGSDGLPNDPLPHPRLWGTFPRVLGKYCRDEKLFSLGQAVHKMTGLPAARFGFADRGLVRESYFADLVLFDPRTIRDTATFDNPACPAKGIERVWVNGVLSYRNGVPTGRRSGRFIKRSATVTSGNFDSRQFKEHR